MRLKTLTQTTRNVLFLFSGLLLSSLSSAASADEIALNYVLKSMVSSAVQTTQEQLKEAILDTLESTSLQDGMSTQQLTTAQNSETVLPVSTTAAE